MHGYFRNSFTHRHHASRRPIKFIRAFDFIALTINISQMTEKGGDYLIQLMKINRIFMKSWHSSTGSTALVFDICSPQLPTTIVELFLSARSNKIVAPPWRLYRSRTVVGSFVNGSFSRFRHYGRQADDFWGLWQRSSMPLRDTLFWGRNS